jgi:hypothetical protein
LFISKEIKGEGAGGFTRPRKENWNSKTVYMLYQDIDYYYFCLEKPITVKGILIKEVYIDPYYEKHNEEFLEAKKKKGIKLTPAELRERIITND